MALRMTPSLMQALEELHRAGSTGADDIACASIFEEHGLAERVEGSGWGSARRVRLTTIGELFADFFFERTIHER